MQAVFLLFDAKEAVEVIEASGGNMFVEVIQDLEINESMAWITNIWNGLKRYF